MDHTVNLTDKQILSNHILPLKHHFDNYLTIAKKIIKEAFSGLYFILINMYLYIFSPLYFQTSRIIAKIACWGKDQMEGSDLQYYLTWLKDQLRAPVSQKVISKLRIHTVLLCILINMRHDSCQ